MSASHPRKILAAVDGSERTNRVVDYLLSLAKKDKSIKVVVLNVQNEPEKWRLRGYESFKKDEIIDRLTRDVGGPIVRGVGRRLGRAGIAHDLRVEIGEPVETIIRCAAEEGCDLIVVGDPRPGVVRRWLTQTAGITFGSVAGKVVQLARKPIVVAR